MSSSTAPPSHAWEFDATRFAEFVARRRAVLGVSTRELSRRAGISQAYVVALERARRSGGAQSPTPTVDVLARLAHALDTTPEVLLRAALQRTGRHVLLLRAGDDQRVPMSTVRRMGDPDVDWVWAAASTGTATPRSATHRIDLRRSRPPEYDPDTVTRSLRCELDRLHPAVRGRQLGLVFADTSAVMTALDDPSPLLQLEHQWGEVVAEAAAEVHARAAWNVCVYELPALQQLRDPAAAVIDLLRSHDTLWLSRRDGVLTGRDAAHAALHRLRPPGTDRADWAARVSSITTELGHVA